MKNKLLKINYSDRIKRAVKYIEDNIYEEFRLKDIARVACFSEYHFHRIFSAYTGESLASYIRRIRLDNAANTLIATRQSITKISLNAGFQTPAAFAKAFKNRFKLTPTQFRTRGVYIKKEASFESTINQITMEEILKPEIKKIENKEVFSVRAKGPYKKSASEAWGKLCAWAGPRGLLRENTEYIGISLDNPDITDEDLLRFDACITADQNIDPDVEVYRQTIKGGEYAVFTHKGPYEGLNQTYQSIYGNWLLQSKREISENCGFEKYINSPETSKPEDLITEIWIPLK